MEAALRSTSPSRAGAVRVSLACVPCRNRHVRCDASKPICDRCSAEKKLCHYVESRRGGLTRAALAKRRTLCHTRLLPPLSPAKGVAKAPRSSSLDTSSAANSETTTSIASTSTDNTSVFGLTSGTTTSSWPAPPLDNDNDPFIDLYYKHFHRLHPCALPRRRLSKMLREKQSQAHLRPLISVMRLIGCLFSKSDDFRRLQEAIPQSTAEECYDASNPFQVQYHLLYSIALYWCDKGEQSLQEMDRATRLALDLGMHRRRFAVDRGQGDLVLQECWRRTWWQLYLVDAYYAAMKHSSTFATCDVDTNTELPCEESEYESGAIPIPKTLEDFACREFAADDHTFSSFAYLIGGTRGVSSAIARSLQKVSDGPFMGSLESVDIAVDGWMLHLPESKQEILSRGGEADELMFQAYLGQHATMVGLHRRFSSLAIDPVEGISSCATAPGDGSLPRSAEFEAIHTARCLKSIEEQARLMTLPIPALSHTPFAVCMIVTGMITLLSACKFHLTGQRLAAAREQLRMTIGCLKAFAKVWPRAKRSLQEVQTIAREVLGQDRDRDRELPAEARPPDLDRDPAQHGPPTSQGQGLLDSSSEGDYHMASTGEEDTNEEDWSLSQEMMPMPLPALDGLDAYFLNLEEMQPDFAAWCPSY